MAYLGVVNVGEFVSYALQFSIQLQISTCKTTKRFQQIKRMDIVCGLQFQIKYVRSEFVFLEKKEFEHDWFDIIEISHSVRIFPFPKVHSSISIF